MVPKEFHSHQVVSRIGLIQSKSKSCSFDHCNEQEHTLRSTSKIAFEIRGVITTARYLNTCIVTWFSISLSNQKICSPRESKADPNNGEIMFDLKSENTAQLNSI